MTDEEIRKDIEAHVKQTLQTIPADCRCGNLSSGEVLIAFEKTMIEYRKAVRLAEAEWWHTRVAMQANGCDMREETRARIVEIRGGK